MNQTKASRKKPGGMGSPEPRNVVSDLIPQNPLSARTALIQVSLLIGIPLALLLLARYLLHRFFPSLGY